MLKNREPDDRMFRWLIFTVALILVAIVYLSMALYVPTHESCVLDCAKKYRLNIDGSWFGCEILCDEKFNR